MQLPLADGNVDQEQSAERGGSFIQQRQPQQSILKATGTSVTSPVASKSTASIKWPQFKAEEEQEQQQRPESPSFLKGISSFLGGFSMAPSRSSTASPLQQQQQVGADSFVGFNTGPRNTSIATSLRWASGPGRQSSASGMSLMEGSSVAGSMTGSMTGSMAGGLKRGIMSLKSVKHVALSQAAKAAIISTIADNAVASFLIIQVGLCLLGP